MSNPSANNWRIFEGDRKEPHDAIRDEARFPDPPKWRCFSSLSAEEIEKDSDYWQLLLNPEDRERQEQEAKRGQKFFIRSGYAKASKGRSKSSRASNPEDEERLKDYARVMDAVNAAILLRRPLLVTGNPGSSKTSLAYAIAYQLKLGPVLVWSITARSALREGLYQYDAIARLQDAQLQQINQKNQTSQPPTSVEASAAEPSQPSQQMDIGQYVRLGAVGTAFIKSRYPRVLLIDEIDKSDMNLPNDLLNLFEEGEFEIPELVRLSKQGKKTQDVESADGLTVKVREGKVRCAAFPIVVMTSNGERDFPPAFLRRCLRVRMPDPDEADLQEIVKSHLEDAGILKTFKPAIDKAIQTFIQKQEESQEGTLATDQLLNLVYLLTHKAEEELEEIILKPLTSAEDER